MESRQGYLRTTAFAVLAIGACASTIFTLHAGRNNGSWLLKLIMVTWVLSPFILLLIAAVFAKKWPADKRRTLYATTLAVSVITVVVYIVDAMTTHTKAAAVFVVTPPVTWLLLAIVAAVAARM